MSGFGRSIGGKQGSGDLDVSSVGIGRASGSAAAGFKMPSSGTAPGANTRGASKPEPARPKMPMKRDELAGKKSQM